MGPVVQQHDDVGSGARLDGGGDARLEVVGVDRLEGDGGAEGPSGFAELTAELLVAGGHEVVPAEEVEFGPLGERRGPAPAEDALEPGGARDESCPAEEGAAVDAPLAVGSGAVHRGAPSRRSFAVPARPTSRRRRPLRPGRPWRTCRW